MTLFILLPAFNEEKDLERLVTDIDAKMSAVNIPFKIVVVDDGSSDNTYPIAVRLSRRYPVVVLKHEQNRGYGAAVNTGFSHILSGGSEDDILVTMDCDNTHPPAYIPLMIDQIKKGYELVIASRYQKGGGQVGFCLRRKMLSISARILLRTVFPVPGVRDYTSGYRAYRLSALKKAREYYGEHWIESTGFTVPMEVLLKLRQLNVTVKEIPLVLRYDLKDGVSKMKALKTILAYLKVIRSLKRR